MHSVITVIFLSCFIKSIKHQSKPLASLSCICPWRVVWRLHVFSTGAVKSAIPLPASHFICAGMQWSGVQPLQRCWIVRLMTAVLRDSVSRAKPLWHAAQLQPQTGVMCFALPLLSHCSLNTEFSYEWKEIMVIGIVTVLWGKKKI